MPSLVTAGSVLRCNKGTAPTALLVPGGHNVMAGSYPVATIADCKPGINVVPFGQCNSPNNPTFNVNFGGGPCTPFPLTGWTPGAASVLVGGLPVVNGASQCNCKWGGVISVVTGQTAVNAG
jgi:hypothetical protein